MPYDSKATLEARLIEVRAALTKVRTSQAYQSGQVSLTRGNYKQLLDEEQWILGQINLIDSQNTSSGGIGGTTNKVTFQRPE
jgi:hypothetical protein